MDEKETNLPATTKKNTLKNNDDDRKWFSFPNSPASNTVISVVSHVGDLETFGKRLEHNSHSSQIEFFSPPEKPSFKLLVAKSNGILSSLVALSSIL